MMLSPMGALGGIGMMIRMQIQELFKKPAPSVQKQDEHGTYLGHKFDRKSLVCERCKETYWGCPSLMICSPKWGPKP